MVVIHGGRELGVAAALQQRCSSVAAGVSAVARKVVEPARALAMRAALGVPVQLHLNLAP